jgi:Rps23 Pro-64 3,4-dihydroxylase Tpa1-like proline 4-hydroxylase
MKDFIFEINNALPKKLCKEIISLFEKDTRKSSGVTSYGNEPNVKKTTELCISNLAEWYNYDMAIFEALNRAMAKYHKKFPILNKRSMTDFGYHIKRYVPGDFFDWHADNNDLSVCARQYIAIFYLNDVKNGGETEFKHFDRAIKPKAGKVVFFPAGWTHEHRGVSPIGQNKYVVTVWLSLK